VTVTGLAGALLLAACGTTATAAPPAAGPSDSASPSALLPAPKAPIGPLLDEEDVARAVDQLDGFVGTAMERTGVPGIAVAVVYKDKVIFRKGYGVRKVGAPEKIDPGTVFQVASVSKPVASTIVAGVVSEGKASWSDPVRTWNPKFTFSDPYVSEHATLGDLLSHRSGLPGVAGDELEDLGWSRDHIQNVLRYQPLAPFRDTYDYSNFGFTAGGIAAADAKGQSWEDLADSMLFRPLGMQESSYSHAAYEGRDNKALIHVPVGPAADKKWTAKWVRNADAEAPAGGLSTSVDDLAKWLRLQLGNGTFEGQQLVDSADLQVTHLPHADSRPATVPGERTQFYGLGWNVTDDDNGRVQLSHSGAFFLGAATSVQMLQTEQLGIITLTNGRPTGAAEAINNQFFDAAQHGTPTVDWLEFFGDVFEQIFAANDAQGAKWATPPADAKPPQANSVYEGTYHNSYYGPLQVAERNGSLVMTMGPPAEPVTFALAPFDGDTFTFQTIGETAAGRSGAAFTVGSDGKASVNLAFYDTTGLGTFERT